MILTGILRHYAMILLQSTPKKQPLPKIREQRSLMRAVNLRSNANQLSPASFQNRRSYMVGALQNGTFLAEPENRGKPAANPMSDPAMMEGMMGMMKGNVAMMVPQTLIMGWINAFFSGFVIRKCQRQLMERLLLTVGCSEATLPTHTAIQVDVTVRGRYQRPRRAVGLQSVMVFSDVVWFATRVQLHTWK